MPITLDHQLKEYIPHNAVEFPISYFHDELATLPNFAGPLHWHPDFEIATAECVSLDYQVGENHIILEAGDSIFVNRNTIHGIKQLSGGNARSNAQHCLFGYIGSSGNKYHLSKTYTAICPV